jgi:hypothetical protein
MTPTDITRHQARLLLTREATLAERYARRYCAALHEGDAETARRYNREYRLSAFRCRALGALLRTPAIDVDVDGPGATATPAARRP